MSEINTRGLEVGSWESVSAHNDSFVRRLTTLRKSPALSDASYKAVAAYAALFAYCNEIRTANNEGRLSNAELREARPRVARLAKSLKKQNKVFMKLVGFLLNFKILSMEMALEVSEFALMETNL